MGSTSRQQSSTLEILEQIQEQPYRYDLFGLLRYIEAIHKDLPRLGESVKASEDPIIIRQQPSMAFAPSTISKFIPGYKSQDQVFNYPYGVFGPNGPLPLHLTEYAYERELQQGDDTFSRFADVFHHRMVSLLYRAWANTQPVIGMDRSESNRFDQYVAALGGMFIEESQSGDNTLYPKIFRAGLFSQQTRSADGLETLLSDYFQMSFKVQQYSGGWLTLNRKDHFLLGTYGQANILGENSCLGSKVYDCQHKFTVTTNALDFAQFQRLLPNTKSYKVLYELISEYAGLTFEWDLLLKLKADETPKWSLGDGGNLGWTLWLGDADPSLDTVEVQLQSRRPEF